MKAKYITDFVCTYNLIDEYENSFWLYQIQILQAFNLEEFDDEKINIVIQNLYKKYKDNIYISTIIQSEHFKQYDIDDLSKFIMCFNYNSFFLIHSILCSLINNMKINENNYNKLLKSV